MREVHSYTSLSVLASCARKFELSYVHELETPETVNQRAGKAFDKAVNHLYLVGWDEAAAAEALVEEWGDFSLPLGAKTHLTLDFMVARLAAYMREREASPTILERCEPVPGLSAEEHTITRDGLMLRGIPDFVVRDPKTGKVYVVDLKTTSAWIGDHWMKRFRLGFQLRVYAAIATEVLGEEVEAGIINAVYVGKEGIDPPEKWKGRKSNPSAANIVDFLGDAIEDMWDWAKGLRVVEEACEASGLWPCNEMACADYGGCPYLGVCTVTDAHARGEAIRRWKM